MGDICSEALPLGASSCGRCVHACMIGFGALVYLRVGTGLCVCVWGGGGRLCGQGCVCGYVMFPAHCRSPMMTFNYPCLRASCTYGCGYVLRKLLN